MPSTLPKILQELFKPDKWHWYVVDFRNWYNPTLIRKHFDSEQQAKDWITRNCKVNKFEALYGVDVLKMKLSDPPKNARRIERMGLKPKFNYPLNCTTQYQKQIYRNKIRRKMKRKESLPVTKQVIKEIIEDMPMLFMKRLKQWRNYHWAYSDPLKETKYWMGVFEDMQMVVKLTNIARCLNKYYDVGPYATYQVAEKLYSMYQLWVEKWLKPDVAYGPRLSRVEAEFIARGFKPIFEVNPDLEENSFVKSIHLSQIYVHPIMCWHSYEEKEEYEYYIYDFQAMVGIPGYTAAHVAGLDRRK